MNNDQNFINKTAIALSSCEEVESFSISFKTIIVDGKDEKVPDLQVVKKGAKNGREGNS